MSSPEASVEMFNKDFLWALSLDVLGIGLVWAVFSGLRIFHMFMRWLG